MFDLSDDDSFSTQLEGKKLKNRGAKIEGDGSTMGSEELDISGNTPVIGDDEIETGQEFFTEREIEPETEEERDERLKKEITAAKLQQSEQDKSLQNDKLKNPNLELSKIENGIMLSQNDGKAVNESKFRQHGPETDEDRKDQQKMLEKTDSKDDRSIAAKMLPDIRGKSGLEI